MANVAIGSPFVLGGVAVQSLQEGRAVVFATSGGRANSELPNVSYAASGTATGVYCVILPPDYFPRPTRQGFFTAPDRQIDTLDPRDATLDQAVLESDTFYKIGPSLFENPTIPSGWKVQLHRGGVYTVASGAFIDTASIRVPGATIGVAANGQWQYSASNVVGEVREYRSGKLTFTLYQK